MPGTRLVEGLKQSSPKSRIRQGSSAAPEGGGNILERIKKTRGVKAQTC